MRATLILAALLAAAAPAAAQTARATSGDDVIAQARPGQVVIRGNRSVQNATCSDSAIVGGTQNRTTITGACRRLSVGGTGNEVTASLAPGAMVMVGGTGNRVRYTVAGRGAAPQIIRGGQNNTVEAAR